MRDASDFRDQPEHKVIVVPGLGDDRFPFPLIRYTHRLLTAHWPIFYGLKPEIYDVLWHTKEETKFGPKLTRLVDAVRRAKDIGFIVSLVGTSAGGSAVLNAFHECQEEVNGVVAVCSHLRIPTQQQERLQVPLTETARLAPPFIESTRRIHELQNAGLPQSFLDRVMTITSRDKFGQGADELVPASVSYIEGAKNIEVIEEGHARTIGKSLIKAHIIANFLKSLSI